MKTCNFCRETKPLDEFYSRNGHCKNCHNTVYREVRATHQRTQFHYYRDLIIQYLGSKCAYCGYDENVLGLEIDHIDNDGWAERTNRKGANSTMLKRWFDSGCEGLQLLCGTCHTIKSRAFNMRLYI